MTQRLEAKKMIQAQHRRHARTVQMIGLVVAGHTLGHITTCNRRRWLITMDPGVQLPVIDELTMLATSKALADRWSEEIELLVELEMIDQKRFDALLNRWFKGKGRESARQQAFERAEKIVDNWLPAVENLMAKYQRHEQITNFDLRLLALRNNINPI